MKVCVPVSENKGMESVPFGHFGSAPEFVICDLQAGLKRMLIILLRRVNG